MNSNKRIKAIRRPYKQLKTTYINLANISSKDLEGEILSMVDRNFWDLI